MINITQKIYIKADINTIWAYLTDFSHSLMSNRFHTNIVLPLSYTLGKMDTFKINHNFGFGNYDMVAEIKDYVPPNRLSISEYCPDDLNKGFPHSVIFQIEEALEKCELSYTVSGTYGGRVQDISFKPILNGVIKDELLRIKNAIESSETAHKIITSETAKTI